MKAELYVVPMGVMDQQMMATIEAFFPDLSMSVSNLGSQIIDNKDRYEHLRKIKDIEIPITREKLYNELHTALTNKDIKEMEVFMDLAPVLESAVKEIQNQPQIHVPTPEESSQILRKNIILEP